MGGMDAVEDTTMAAYAGVTTHPRAQLTERAGEWFLIESNSVLRPEASQIANEKVSSMKSRARFSLILQGGLLFIMIAGSAFASDVIAVMKSTTVVYRLKASNGAFLGQINPPGGVQAVGCDGETIAVLSNSGTISRYSADTGAFLGQINPAGRCTDVQVSGGVIIARSSNTASRYSTRTGAFLGQSHF